jgi:hypothetical protein
MSGLDLFAWIVLVILLATLVRSSIGAGRSTGTIRR